MTAVAAPEAQRVTGGAFTGTGELVRFMLRRDKRFLPGWVGGIALFVPYFFTAFQTLFPTREDLLGVAGFTTGPILSVLGGPGYGTSPELLDLHTFFAAVYVLYFLVAAGFMNILLVSRHTRAEEQTGRWELLRAGVVGAHAPLAATMVVVVIADVAVAVLVTAMLVAFEAPLAGAALVACGIAATGLVFAGVAAVTAQVYEFSRSATAAAAGVLGAAFLVRAVGDTLEENGSALSWLSPFAWAQQTRPFVDHRWWPLLLSLAVSAALVAVAYRLSATRDLGAGLRAQRPGRRHAWSWVQAPWSFAARLHLGGIRGWVIGLAVGGLVYGGTTQAVVDSFAGADSVLDAMLSGAGDPVEGYLAMMAALMSLAVAAYGVLGVQRIRGEERDGRAEPVLSTATTTGGWLLSHVLVVLAASLLLLGWAGLMTGVGAAAVTGEVALVGDVLLAAVACYPAVAVVVAVAAAAYGIAPGALGAAWALLLLGVVTELFGGVVEPPALVAAVSPWHHVAVVPFEEPAAVPTTVLLVLAALGVAAATAAFHRRDLRPA